MYILPVNYQSITNQKYQSNEKINNNHVVFQSQPTFGGTTTKTTNTLKIIALNLLACFGLTKKKSKIQDSEIIPPPAGMKKVEDTNKNVNIQDKVPSQNLPKFVTEFGENLYRGRRPEENEFAQLHDMGITTIVDFTTESSTYEAERAAQYGMEYVKLPFEMSNILNYTPIKPFLNVINKIQATQGKLYVHCEYGTDRTGLMVNLYKLHNGLPIQDSNSMIKDLAKTLYTMQLRNK